MDELEESYCRLYEIRSEADRADRAQREETAKILAELDEIEAKSG